MSDPVATSTNTTYQEWDRFTSVAGPNAPDIGEINPNGIANAFDSNAGAPPAGSSSFVTSGGNIYSFGGVIRPVIEVPQPNLGVASYTEVLLQLKTQGQEIDTDDLLVDGVSINGLGNYGYTELSRVSLGGFGGFAIEHLWTFTVPGNAASFTFTIPWGVSSSSFDRVSVDTFTAVPEPSMLSAIGLAAAALVRRRR